ncbi:hypothetical protein [Haloarcula sp. JP-L23]|uniref:hypothetical protein n=1 Tax=Haloarcula sp. JP-L23 TaxID=2716717 RepID=UPI001877D90D
MQGRKSAYWMEQLDERIMEFIRSEGWASPRLLEGERGFSASEGRIRERCMCLHYAGFIEPIHGDMYDLTSEGILYLKGDLDAEHYPEPTPSKVFKERYATPSDWAHAEVKPYWP